MSGRSVIWFGPVSSAQRAGATVQGADEHMFTCTGDSHPNCAEQLGAYADGDGRHLPGLLRHFGIADDAEVYIGAFSNGGSAVKRILLNAYDRAAIRAVALSDATYELWADAARTTPGVAEGYVAFALEALDGSRLLLATASGAPNNVGGDAQPSGSDTLAELAREIGRRSGQPLEERTAIPGYEALDPPPQRVWTRGGVILADFGAALAHAQHATKLAPLLWPNVVQPWADGGVAALGSATPGSTPADVLGADPKREAAPIAPGTGAGLAEAGSGPSLFTVLVWSGGTVFAVWLLYHLLARRGDRPTWRPVT